VADGRKNFAYGEVRTAPSPGSSGTSLVLKAGHGARMPATPFNATVAPKNQVQTPDNAEIVRVTDVTGDTLTIVRAQEGTSAQTVTASFALFASITEKMLEDIEAEIATGVAAEAALRASADIALATGISSEATARAAADTAEATARANADTTEATTRAAGDTTNATAITAEATARANADTTEATNRAAGDATNATAITAEATARASADTAEATARANADTAEATARAAGDTATLTTAEAYADTVAALKLAKSANLSDVADIQKARTYVSLNSPTAMQHAQEAAALAGTTPFVLMALGDSLTEGVNLTLEQTWLYQLGQSLAESVNIDSPGSGYCCANALATGKWTSVTGTGSTLGSNGLGTRSWDSNPALANDRSLTINCDRLKLFYTKGPNYGAFTVKVDGVLVATLDSYNAGGLVAATWDSGALTAGSHTIRIDTINTGSAKPVATFAVSIAGAFAYLNNFASGVQVWNGGHSFAPSWVPNAVELGHIALIDPDICVLSYGANDPDVGPSRPRRHGKTSSTRRRQSPAQSHTPSHSLSSPRGARSASRQRGRRTCRKFETPPQRQAQLSSTCTRRSAHLSTACCRTLPGTRQSQRRTCGVTCSLRSSPSSGHVAPYRRPATT
jgi:hypothetical protein